MLRQASSSVVKAAPACSPAAEQQQCMLLNALHRLLRVAAQITSAWHAARPEL
jgi:hypothetical protein